MLIVTRLRRYVSLFAERRRYRSTERLMANLPLEVRKDIGWPGSARGLRDVASDRADPA